MGFRFCFLLQQEVCPTPETWQKLALCLKYGALSFRSVYRHALARAFACQARMDFLAARALFSPYEVEDPIIDAIVKETDNTLRMGRVTKLEFFVGRTMVKVAREPWPDYTHVHVPNGSQLRRSFPAAKRARTMPYIVGHSPRSLCRRE